MADDNSRLKYARYAIGEIVLVVVGILIALQVNNWNEDRIEQNKVKALLNGIHDDLKKDKERIAFLHEFYREKSSIMQLLESKWARDLLSSCLIQGNTIFANLESFDAMNANLQLAIKNYE